MSFLPAVFAGQELYQVSLDFRGPIIFRLLPYKSFLQLQRLLQDHPGTQDTVEDEVWNLCVLEHPYDYSLGDVMAGTVSTVANLILFLSGLPDYEDKDALLQFSRQRASSELFLQIQSFICAAFPSYKPEDLESLNLHQLFLRLAQAEIISGKEVELHQLSPDNKPTAPVTKPIDFDKENEELIKSGVDSFDPHDLFGLRIQK